MPLVTAARALALSTVRTLRAARFDAYWVGGCVRDQLLGLDPKDYDVATSATPDEVEGLFPRTVAVGKSFGVVRVLDVDNSHVAVEVATFRKDGGYADGRHPVSVSFSDAREDALRRDFTINGLFYDPLDERVTDYVGGQADLAAHVVRCIGDPDRRFDEDKLRMLRAVRFACRFTFDIEPLTWGAIVRRAGEIEQVSAERARDELNLMLTGKARSRALRMLAESGLLDAVLPEVAATVTLAGANIFAATLAMLDLLDGEALTPELAWSALLHGVEGGPDAAGEVMRRLHHPNALTRHVAAAIGGLHLPGEARGMSLAKLKRMLRSPEIETVLELYRVARVARGQDAEGWRFCRARLDEYARAQAEAGLWPALPLNGDDLRALGMPPGPLYARVLGALEDAVLEGKVSTRDEALAFAKGIAGAMDR